MVRQISISESHNLLFDQKPSSDPDGAPKSPLSVLSKAKEEKSVDPDGQDISPEQPVHPHSLEPKEESGPGSEARFYWDLHGAPAGESGSLVAAALKLLIPLEDGPASQVTSPPAQAAAGSSKQFDDSDDKNSWPGPLPAKPPRQREALHQVPYTAVSELGLESLRARAPTPGLAEPSQGLEPGVLAPTEELEWGKLGLDVQEGRSREQRRTHGQALGPDGLSSLSHQSLEEELRAEERKQVGQGGQGLHSEQSVEAQSVEAQGLKTGHSELPQQDFLLASLPYDTPQALAEAEAPAPGKPSPPRDSLSRGAQPGGGGPQKPTQTMTELEAQPMPPPTTHTGEQGPLQSGEPRAENRPEDPGTDSGLAGVTPSLGDSIVSKPPADPDHIFHVIFLGDSNVGKTSFLHLLHQNTFATGLTATVGKGPPGEGTGEGRPRGPADKLEQAGSEPSLKKLQVMSWPQALH